MNRYQDGPEIATASATAETVAFAENVMLSGSGVKAIHVSLTGTGNDVDSLTRIVLKAGGRPIIDINELQLAAWISWHAKKAELAAADTRFTIPLYLTGGSAPRGRLLRLELTKDNTGVVGTAHLSYTLNDAPSAHYDMLIGQSGNVAASGNNVSFPITQQGSLVGFVLPRTTSLTRIRMYSARGQEMDLIGAGFLEAQQLLRGTTTTLNTYFRLDQAVPVVAGATRLELTVGSAWTTSDEIAVHTIVPHEV